MLELVSWNFKLCATNNSKFKTVSSLNNLLLHHMKPCKYFYIRFQKCAI